MYRKSLRFRQLYGRCRALVHFLLTSTVSSQIRKQLDTVVSPKSKLSRPLKKPKATWVEPVFTAEFEYRDLTSEGLLRASSFKGLSKAD
jgi:bifunctional non-homologous end joining protein LigD